MTSLTALTHAAAAPAFNGLFYATVATVIPVLFLAISYQSTAWQEMVTAYVTASDTADSAGFRLSHLSIRSIRLEVRSWTLGLLVSMIMLSGAFGEIYAITALYRQQATGGAPLLVLTATIFLTVVVVAGIAMIAINKAVRDLGPPPRRRRRPPTEPPSEQHHDAEDGT